MVRQAFVVLFFVSGCELAVSLKHFDDGCRPGRGPSSILIQAPGGDYCIDTTEVTKGDYAAFLTGIGSNGPSTPLPAGCEGESSFTPAKNWPPAPGTETFPVSQIDW